MKRKRKEENFFCLVRHKKELKKEKKTLFGMNF